MMQKFRAIGTGKNQKGNCFDVVVADQRFLIVEVNAQRYELLLDGRRHAGIGIHLGIHDFAGSTPLRPELDHDGFVGFLCGCGRLLKGSIPSNGFACAPGPEASQKEQYHSVCHRVLYDSSDAKTHNASPVVIEMGKCAGRRQSGSFLAHL